MPKLNMKLEFRITLTRPPRATIAEVRDYILEAVQSYRGGLHPPFAEDENDPGDPLFELDRNSVKIVRLK